MNRRYAACLIALYAVSVLVACTIAPSNEASTVPKQFHAGQILVTLPSATPEQWAEVAQAIAREYTLQLTGEFPLASLGVQCLVFQVSSERPIAELLTRLNADSRVALAQANQVFQTSETTAGDPYAPLQYGVAQIRAAAAHEISTGQGVKIAVIDTGAETDHPDLSKALQSMNFVEGGEHGFNTDRHGTAVVGVIVANAGNGIGIVGVAPGAEVLVTKACWYPDSQADQALCSSWTLAKAVDYVLQKNVQVLNLSLAGPYDALLSQLLDAALQQGVTVVAAADQQGDEPGFPAAHPGVIAVIASDTQGRSKLPPWATDKRPVAAPGLDILTTVPSTAYGYVSGSSLAAAHVSGVTALLLEHKPELTVGEVMASLQAASSSSSPTEVDTIDACSALQQVAQFPVCPDPAF